FKVEVNETKTHWIVNLQQTGAAAEAFQISKDDYAKFDDDISFLFTGKSYMLDLVTTKEGYTIFTGNSYRNVTIHNDESLLHESLKSVSTITDSTSLAAGMPGKIVKVCVKAGQRVPTGSPLIIM